MKFTQHSNAVMVLAAMGLAGGCDSEQGFQYSVWFNTECPDYNCDVGVTVPMTAECVSEICANGAFKAGAPADLVANCDCTVNSSCQFTADTLLVGGETCACESISYLLGPGDPLPLAQDVEADVCTNMDDGSPDDYDGCYCEPALSQLGIDVAVQDLRDFFWANRVNPEASACSLQAVADCDGEEGCPAIEPFADECLDLAIQPPSGVPAGTDFVFTIDPLTSFIELGSTLTAVSGTAYVDNAAPAVLDIWVLPSDCTYDGNVFETWGFRLVTPIDFDVQSGAFQADPSTAWDLLGGGLVNGMAVSLETGRPSTATGQFNSQQGTWYMSYTQPVVTETLDIYLAGTFTPN